MDRQQRRYCLAFQDNITLAKKIDTILGFQLSSFVKRMERFLPLKKDAPVSQFHLKRFLIAVFVYACTKPFVNGMQSPHNVIDMFL